MNILDATIDDARIVFADGAWLPIPDRYKGSVAIGQKVAFGLRPDDLYPTGHGLPSGAVGTVYQRDLRVSVTEPLGNETLVFVEFAGRDWVSRMLNPRALGAGEMIAISFDLSKAHLFAGESGQAIKAAEG
jgi:multiple sugar transport system ATP-binding protein